MRALPPLANFRQRSLVAARLSIEEPAQVMRICAVSGRRRPYLILDVALRHGFPHGGWCPQGRKAEDGVIGGQYRLDETPTDRYSERTEWNVRDSDGTIVFTLGKEIRVGSLATLQFCQKHNKRYVHIARYAGRYDDPALCAQRFVREYQVKVLNVAGSRESEEPGIWRWAYQVIKDAFFWGEAHPNMLGGPGGLSCLKPAAVYRYCATDGVEVPPK